MVLQAWMRGAFMLPGFFFALTSLAAARADQQQARIAQLVFHNECAAKIACLTSWNRGEEFASLGIGHFIWYPSGTPETDRPFAESFPLLLQFFQEHGIRLPDWLELSRGCPWHDRDNFIAAASSPRMQELRLLLQETMALQAAFLQRRLEHALPAMLEAVSADLRPNIQRQFRRVAASPMGAYVLTDYVNFKGEGLRLSERYDGEGWGLMQVLVSMQGDASGLGAIQEFASSANVLLTRRVAHAPKNRNETRWLPGWRKRLGTYEEEARRAM